MTRRDWIKPCADICIVRQCELASVPRSTVYAVSQRSADDEAFDLQLCKLMDEQYTRHPFYGSRRMVVFLKRKSHRVNRKRVLGVGAGQNR